MFGKKKDLKILAEKSEIFGTIPEEQLSAEKIDEIKQIPLVAVGDIRNPNHVLSALKVLSTKRVDAFLPVLSYAGIEYGDWPAFGKYLKQVKTVMEKKLKIYVLDPVLVGAPSFFRALNTSHAAEIKKRFGFYNPCLGCRIYSLAIRVPLCKKINAKIMISGEIIFNNNEVDAFKVHQNLNSCSLLMKGFGIDLWDGTLTGDEADLVLRNLNIKNLLDDEFNFSCVMNKCCLSDTTSIGKSKLARKYYEDFAIPAAAKILSRVFSGSDVDYEREVSETLISKV